MLRDIRPGPVPQWAIQRNEEDRDSIQFRWNSAGPNIIEFDAADRSQQISLIRLYTEPQHPVRHFEVGRVDGNIAPAKLRNRLGNSGCVGPGASHEKVYIAGKVRPPMEGNSISADDEELNPARIQRLYKLAQVLLKGHSNRVLDSGEFPDAPALRDLGDTLDQLCRLFRVTGTTAPPFSLHHFTVRGRVPHQRAMLVRSARPVFDHLDESHITSGLAPIPPQNASTLAVEHPSLSQAVR